MKNAALERLKDRSYKTYLARIQAHKRLRLVGAWWNIAQVALGAAILSVSIAFLAGNSSALPGGDYLLAVLSVLSLIVSIVISNLNYGSQAEEMFRSYREIQSLSAWTERILDTRVWVSPRTVAELSKRYQDLLDASANHSSIDHEIASTSDGAFSIPVRLLPIMLGPFILPGALTIGSITMVIYVVAHVAAESAS